MQIKFILSFYNLSIIGVFIENLLIIRHKYKKWRIAMASIEIIVRDDEGNIINHKTGRFMI